MVATGVAIAALIVGCGEVSGTAQPVSKELFDPCAVVPDEAIRAAGADPAVVVDDIKRPEDDAWTWCIWRGEDSFVTVFSTTDDLRQVREQNKNSSTAPVTDLGSDAFIFRDDSKDTSSACNIAFAWRLGSSVVRVERNLASSTRPDTCSLASSGATLVKASLPK